MEQTHAADLEQQRDEAEFHARERAAVEAEIREAKHIRKLSMFLEQIEELPRYEAVHDERITGKPKAEWPLIANAVAELQRDHLAAERRASKLEDALDIVQRLPLLNTARDLETARDLLRELSQFSDDAVTLGSYVAIERLEEVTRDPVTGDC